MRKKHLGRNIARIRDLKGMKQDTLAELLGVTQQTISTIEKNEDIGEKKMEYVASALGVTVDVIKNFDEEAAINIVNNAFHNISPASGNYLYDNNLTFSLLEKVVELYERLLASERDKNETMANTCKLALQLAEEMKKLKREDAKAQNQ